MRKSRVILLTVAVLALVIISGCATKKYVRQEVLASDTQMEAKMAKNQAEVNSQINELSDLNKQLNSRLEQVSDRATKAEAKADEAKTIGGEARIVAEKANKTATQLRNDFDARNNFVAVVTKNVLFGFNRSNLTDDSKAILDEAAKLFAGNPNYIMVLEGYADHIGSAEYNFMLSEKRVKNVIRYLVGEKSVNINKIYTVGLGELNPVADNDTTEGRQQNRRVTVKIMEAK